MKCLQPVDIAKVLKKSDQRGIPGKNSNFSNASKSRNCNGNKFKRIFHHEYLASNDYESFNYQGITYLLIIEELL